MSLSSFCVVTNALRLNFFRIHDPKRDRKHRHAVHRAANHPVGSAYNNTVNPAAASAAAEIKEETSMEKVISIEGMMCQHCVAHVTKALAALPGVETVSVSLENNNATVTGSADDAALTAAVKDAGYEVTGIQ